jgi:hypothetical protein
MKNEEYQRFLSKLERFFPKFKEWLQEPGRDWQEMIQTYYEGLTDENVTLDEAISVLNGWNTGRIDGAPVGFENQRFLANLLKAVRDERAKKLAKQSQNDWSRDIFGDCDDLPIRSKVPNRGPLVGRMVAEFERLLAVNLSKGASRA